MANIRQSDQNSALSTSTTGIISIDRCYCEQKSFRDLITLARRDQLDLARLAVREGCGTHCGWCVAYLRRGLQSGETVFHELLAKQTLDDQSGD